MKDYSASYAGRHKVVRWVESYGEVIQAQGFYCTNGDRHGIDTPNILDSDGNSSPNYDYEFGSYPMYFFPEVGSSIGLDYTFETEREAVQKAVDKLEKSIAADQHTLDKLWARL